MCPMTTILKPNTNTCYCASSDLRLNVLDRNVCNSIKCSSGAPRFDAMTASCNCGFLSREYTQIFSAFSCTCIVPGTMYMNMTHRCSVPRPVTPG